MLAFKTLGGGEFGFVCDFKEHGFANMSFFAPDRKDILFHLSLRMGSGQAVVNLRTDGVWGTEIMHAVALEEVGDTVLVQIGGSRVAVSVNDLEICAYDGDFPNLDTISFVNFNGGIVESTVLVGGPANETRTGEGEIYLTGFMDVEGWAVDPGLPVQDIVLHVAGLSEPVSVIRRPNPDIARKYRQSDPDVGVLASLPGRIWEALKTPAGTLDVSLLANGIECGEGLTLTRELLLERIQALYSMPDQSTYDVLLAIEHIRFADLWADLPDALKDRLTQAARLFGVFEYMRKAESGTSAMAALEHAPAPTVTVHPNQMLLRTAQGRFGTRFAANANDEGKRPIALLREVLQDFPLPPDVEKHLFLSVTEAFCATDSFEDLHAFVLPRLAKPFVPEDSAWHNSCILPFLFMDGRLDDLKKAFWSLAEETESWIVTPAIGWTMKSIALGNGQHADDKVLEDLIYAFKRFIERRSGKYWARTQCEALADAAALLVLHADRFADYLRDEIPGFILKHFGLSSAFWRLLKDRAATHDLKLSPQMERAKEAFERLEHATPGDFAAIKASLLPFENAGHPDLIRYRRELLNPGRHAGSAEQLANMLYATDADFNDALIRAVAAPNAVEPFAEVYAADIRRMIQRLYSTVPHAPHLGIQERLGQILPALIRGTSKTDTATLSAMVDDLTRISSHRACFLGMGLTLRMIPSLEAQGQTNLALRMTSHVGELRSVIPVAQHQAMFDSTAVQSALTVLHSMSGPKMPVTQSALNLFPNFHPGPTLPADDSLKANALSPLYSTLVVIFSCQPFLDTRVEAMRQSWLSGLADYGVPYIVVVGDGDGSRDGDVVYLDAPDDYEGLPQKTLATAEWVLKNTGATHIYKIDDDCMLDPGAFFGSLNYLKYDYHGRVIHRHVGGMDRSWHFSKSRSERGTKELDKSPEPSTYCDGGSGYLLSRRAMQALVRASDRPDGQQIIRAAFMEDKLVGDLLALAGIYPSNEDYRIAVQRRTHSTSVPVSRWENSFHPSPLSGTYLAHLDTHEAQADVTKASRLHRLWPRKLWPTFKDVSLGGNTNLLELVSPEDKLETLNAEPVAAIACMRNEMFMLPHFLAHYRKLGVKCFLIADNCSDDGTLEYLLDQPDVVTFSVDTQYSQSQYGVAWQMTLIANLRVGRWSLAVDADELLVYPGWERTTLPKLLEGKAFSDVNAARIYMLDMYPEGPLSTADFTSGDPFSEAGFVERDPFLRESIGRGPFSNSNTVTSALRHRLLPWSRPELFVAQKYALLKYQPWMRPSAGFHYVADIKVSETELIFAHFKYNAQFRQKALDEVARGQHFNNAEEYRKYLALMSEGREVIFDPDLSVAWEDCAEVKRILTGDLGP